MQKLSKLVICLRNNCLSCFPYLKAKPVAQHNYINLGNDQNNNLEGKNLSILIETPPLYSKLKEEEKTLKDRAEDKNQRKIQHYGKNEMEIGLEENSEKIIDELDEKIHSSLEGWEKTGDEQIKSNKLKMYFQSYMKENKNRVNIIRIEYVAPCTAKEFIYFQNSVEESYRMLSKNVDSLEAFAQFGPDSCYKLIHSRYKKILTASSRDFVYVKHFRMIEKRGKKFWMEYSKSIEDERHPVYPEKVRGNIVISGQMVEDIEDGHCLVKSYMEVDFKFSLPLFITKPASMIEMKAYVDKCEERIKELYPKVIKTEEMSG